MKEKLTLKDDLLFKLFFSRNQHELKSFIGAILGKNVKIKKVVHDARLEQLVKEMKYGILDIEVELQNGEIINIEMQVRNHHNIEKRTTFYASKKIVEQIEPKQDFVNLKRVIVIAILGYNLTDLPEYLTETVRVIKGHEDHELNNEVKYYYIELKKFRKQNPDMTNELNQWLSFIDMERGDLLKMAMKDNKEIKEAVEKYEVLTGDEEVKRLAEIRLMSKLEENAALATARARGTENGWKKGIKEGMEQGKKEGIEQGKKEGIEQGKKEGIEQGKKEGIEQGKKEGIEQGKKEGIEQGKKEIVTKLAKMNLTEEQIQEATGLPIEEIRKIIKQ